MMNYEEKYLKYKQKYLQLKEQIGGQNEWQEDDTNKWRKCGVDECINKPYKTSKFCINHTCSYPNCLLQSLIVNDIPRQCCNKHSCAVKECTNCTKKDNLNNYFIFCINHNCKIDGCYNKKTTPDFCDEHK
jgi:hypothetical protein